MFRALVVTGSCAALFVPVVLGLLEVTVAQVMQSNQYQIQSDSVNVGGGFSTSSNFIQESTVGEVATGRSDSSNFQLRAGYQQMQAVTIAITQPPSVTMTPAIGGVGGGTSNGSTTVTVTTDSPAGYELQIEADAAPAMQTSGGGETIADYTPSGVADYTFDTTATDAHFGYSVESADAVTRFINDAVSDCGTGSTNTAQICWDGLSTTPETVAVGSAANQPTGTETTVHFRVGVGGSVQQATGVYTATTTVTAIPL